MHCFAFINIKKYRILPTCLADFWNNNMADHQAMEFHWLQKLLLVASSLLILLFLMEEEKNQVKIKMKRIMNLCLQKKSVSKLLLFCLGRLNKEEL